MKNSEVVKILEKLEREVRDELQLNILPYWLENAVDHKKGGFFGRINFDNQPVSNAEKGLILNTRILWTFSAAYRWLHQPAIKTMADRAFDYLLKFFWDRSFGGMYWMVDSNGKVVDSRKHIYAEAFAIYALSEYYGSFNKPEALELAKQLFELIEEKSYDQVYGGYYEAFTQDWKPLEDVRLSDKDKDEAKSMNTHLHVLEAYTNLYRYWKSPELDRKLRRLINLFRQRIISEDHSSLICFFDDDWSPKSDEVSFGHNIEASWLLPEAAEVLEDVEDIDVIKKLSVEIATGVLERGTDNDGGLFNEANSNSITDDNKDWWAQAEGVVGFLNAFEISGDPRFLEAARNSWSFIKEFMIDKKHGEWHEKVTRSGVPYRLDKVRSWKCPYHNGRMALEVLNRAKNKIILNYSDSEKISP